MTAVLIQRKVKKLKNSTRCCRPKGLHKSLQIIGVRVRSGHVQKTALLGTARIL